jgi:hypothetical protein
MELNMEIKQINDCQNILKIGQALETEEELKCDQLFRNPNTIKWLGERKNNLDKEIIKLEREILESNKKREVLEKKLDGGHFIGTLKFEINFEINNYEIFCYKKDGKLMDKYKSNSHNEIYVNHQSCDKGAVIKELIDHYDICIRKDVVVMFLKSLKTSVEECRPGPGYMLDAIKEKGMKIEINEELTSLGKKVEKVDKSALENKMIFLVGGLMEAPLQAKNFDSDALETQKADIFSELYDLSKTTSFINEYIHFYNGDNFHQEL